MHLYYLSHNIDQFPAFGTSHQHIENNEIYSIGTVCYPSLGRVGTLLFTFGIQGRGETLLKRGGREHKTSEGISYSTIVYHKRAPSAPIRHDGTITC